MALYSGTAQTIRHFVQPKVSRVFRTAVSGTRSYSRKFPTAGPLKLGSKCPSSSPQREPERETRSPLSESAGSAKPLTSSTILIA